MIDTCCFLTCLHVFLPFGNAMTFVYNTALIESFSSRITVLWECNRASGLPNTRLKNQPSQMSFSLSVRPQYRQSLLLYHVFLNHRLGFSSKTPEGPPLCKQMIYMLNSQHSLLPQRFPRTQTVQFQNKVTCLIPLENEKKTSLSLTYDSTTFLWLSRNSLYPNFRRPKLKTSSTPSILSKRSITNMASPTTSRVTSCSNSHSPFGQLSWRDRLNFPPVDFAPNRYEKSYKKAHQPGKKF